MNLISFFGLKVKPKLTRGKGMWNPLNTQILDGGVVCLRDKDVNCFLIPAGNSFVAIDSGYSNSKNTRDGLKRLGIDAESVKAVFLTHLDIDHAGGADDNSNRLFPKAKVYLGREESRYLNGELFRKKVLFHNCRLPIALSEFSTLSDGENVTFGETTVRAVYTFGHTQGHTAYYVNDKWLFSGDCIIANEDGGFCFFDFWNSDTALNKQSLKRLKAFCGENQTEMIFTSHSGILSSERAFRFCDNSPNWQEKGFVFCKNADFDPYFEKR